jgi:hypothetical protein
MDPASHHPLTNAVAASEWRDRGPLHSGRRRRVYLAARRLGPARIKTSSERTADSRRLTRQALHQHPLGRRLGNCTLAPLAVSTATTTPHLPSSPLPRALSTANNCLTRTKEFV